MPEFEFFLVSSLEKVFADERPEPLHDTSINGLIGDRISFQLVYTVQDAESNASFQEFTVDVSGAPAPVRLRDVLSVPSQYPVTGIRDKNYLRTTPGMFPDLLVPFAGKVRPVLNQFKSLWIDLDLSNAKAGSYDIRVRARSEAFTVFGNGVKMQNAAADRECVLHLEVIPCRLPEQELIHTEWFHGDCLADYYKTEVFSEEHWRILANFIRAASCECGINMLLTPIFTPPLDTQVGGERTTIQLVKVSKNRGSYSFDFSLLERWCKICRQEGILYLEIAHFFTQWGALATPKIYVTVDGVGKKLFGWHVAATDFEYARFLQALIPELLSVLHEAGYDKNHLVFHVSDEPNESNMDSYLSAKKVIAPLLEGYTIMDALSDYEFYQKGIVTHPIPANDHIQPFIDNKVADLWVYYCVGQGLDVPNRFFSLPSARNRIMGVLMYLYDIKGFLHWGFNFYNSMFSKRHINPYVTTDSDSGFPSGDPFLVYPADDGSAYLSIRNEVQMEALNDLRALKKLESYKGREYVRNLIQEGTAYTITFKKYPREKEYLHKLRYRVNEEIQNATQHP